MARRPRRTHAATFKAQVAVAALRGDKTFAEIADKFEIHPNQLTAYKAQLLERSSEAFGKKADGTPAPNIEKMEAKIGRLTLENEFSRQWADQSGIAERKKMINRKHDLPLIQQCKALKIHRTTIYREPKPINEDQLDVMTLID